MAVVANFLKKIIKEPNKLIISKRYDFYVKEKEDRYIIYRRWYESKPWHKFCTIYKNTINDPDKWEYDKEGAKKLGEAFVI